MTELVENVLRSIKRYATANKIKTKIRDKTDKDMMPNVAKLEKHSEADWSKPDPERQKQIDRLVSLGKRDSAVKKDGSGNMFMKNWPKQPKDLEYMTKPPKKVQEEMNQWHRIKSILEADDVHTWTKPQKIRIKYFDDKAGKHVTVDHTLHPPKWASGTKPRYTPEFEHREAKKHLRSLGVNARIAHIDHINEEMEVSGAGEIGTDRLVKKYKKETPGQ